MTTRELEQVLVKAILVVVAIAAVVAIAYFTIHSTREGQKHLDRCEQGYLAECSKT